MAIYMWKQTPYTPTTGTKIYMPIVWDLTNYWSRWGVAEWGTIDGNSVIVDDSYLYLNVSGGDSSAWTYSLWVKTISSVWWSWMIELNNQSYDIMLSADWTTLEYQKSPSSGVEYSVTISNPSQRNHICVMSTGSSHNAYLNWVKVISSKSISQGYLQADKKLMNTSYTWIRNAKRAFWEFIFTTDRWNDRQVLNYYNNSKLNYWIS